MSDKQRRLMKIQMPIEKTNSYENDIDDKSEESEESESSEESEGGQEMPSKGALCTSIFRARKTMPQKDMAQVQTFGGVIQRASPNKKRLLAELGIISPTAVKKNNATVRGIDKMSQKSEQLKHRHDPQCKLKRSLVAELVSFR